MNSGFVTTVAHGPAARRRSTRRDRRSGPSTGSVERTAITWSGGADSSSPATTDSTCTVDRGPSASVGVPTHTIDTADPAGGNAAVVELEASCGRLGADRVLQARLEDGRTAGDEARDPLRVDVADGDAVAEAGEAGGSDEADRPGADEEQVHARLLVGDASLSSRWYPGGGAAGPLAARCGPSRQRPPDEVPPVSGRALRPVPSALAWCGRCALACAARGHCIERFCPPSTGTSVPVT